MLPEVSGRSTKSGSEMNDILFNDADTDAERSDHWGIWSVTACRIPT